MRHFLSLTDVDQDELRQLLRRAAELKKGIPHQILSGKILCLLFEKPSTRTRVAFESGMIHLGGHTMFIARDHTQLIRGEPIADTAKVISALVDIIAFRSQSHQRLEKLAHHSTVPVINALSDRFHPCQILADMQTFMEHRGDIAGKKVAWIGAGNNVCQSYIQAAALLDFQLCIACPEKYVSDPHLIAAHADKVSLTDDLYAAAQGAHLLVTDVWYSMGNENEIATRRKDLARYSVDAQLLAVASPDAVVLHCLPAHRDEEISADLLDAPNSIIWEAAKNRMYTQQALLEFLLIKDGAP